MCIHDLFHVLLYLWHTNGSMECTYACMYVNIYVYMYSHTACSSFDEQSDKMHRRIQGTGEKNAPPPPSNNWLVHNYKSSYLYFAMYFKNLYLPNMHRQQWTSHYLALISKFILFSSCLHNIVS
jgi:hypothetical protein